MQRAQMGMDETLLNDPLLAKKLDEREGAKEELQPYKEAYNALNKEVKGLIEQKELEDGTYRCGDFIIRVSQAESVYVEFERAARTKVSIKPAQV